MNNTGFYHIVPRILRPIYFKCALFTKKKFSMIKNFILISHEMARKGRNDFPPNASITIVGILSSPTGIGRGARLMWQEIKKGGRAVEAIDVTETLGMHMTEQLEGVADELAFHKLMPGPIIIHLNPPEFEKLYFKLPVRLRCASRIIAYWAWELELMPKSWRRAAKLCDEIWVPSDFVAMAAKRLLGPKAVQQIKVMPHPVVNEKRTWHQDQWTKNDIRARFGFSSEEFIMGYSFAFSSNFARKNPIAAIRAFQKAFPSDIYPTAKLIIRYRDGYVWPLGVKELQNEAKNENRLIIFDEKKMKISMEEFYSIIDVYISLHRSEGYGLTLMEAANRGIPVIATGWWLAEDISKHHKIIIANWSVVQVKDPQMVYIIPGANWAEPDIDDAANKLYSLYKEKTLLNK
jgi:hypothetical protein